MAQRYYFDLRSGPDTIRDEEGVEARDIDQAIEEAESVIEELRESRELSSPEDNWHLIIRDESGVALKTLPLHTGV